MNETLKPADVARQCNVTTNSIRNWSREFRAHLSAGANAAERHYTARDAVVLGYISTLKAEGMKNHAIAERLAETSFGELETLPAPHIATPGHELATQTVLDGLQQASASIVTVETIISLQRQIEGLQQARQEDYRGRRDTVQAFAFGVIVAAFMFLGMVLLSWLYSGA